MSKEPGHPSPLRRRLAIPVVLLAGLLLVTAAFATPLESPLQEGSPLPILPLEEVERGQRGYGYSVFSGQEPERFEAEVLGVVRNYSPDLSYILMRLTGNGLEEVGVVAGMSGSPVFIQGRLVGAVAYAYPFAKEAIAGVTPIEAMRKLQGVAPVALPVAAPDISALLERPSDPQGILEAELELLRPSDLGGQSAAAVGWGASGFGGLPGAMLARRLGPLSSAGQARQADLGGEMRPGSAVAAVLVDGDLRLAATGTVTERLGDEILAFGHPFLGLGEIGVPMAAAEVITVLPSQVVSFKISNVGSIVGAFEEDRLAGIRGRLGARAETIPLSVRVSGAEPRQFHMELASIPLLTPMLAAVSVLGAQEAAAHATGSMGLDLKVRFDLGPHGHLDLEQAFDGASAAIDSAIYLLTFTRFLVQNSFAEVPLRGIEVEVDQYPTPRTSVLIGGYADRTQVHPGETVRLHLDVAPFRGDPQRREISVELPRDLDSGTYSLLVGDGVSLDAARMALEAASPVRFDQALQLLRRFHSRRDLVVLGVSAGSGLAVAGEVMPQLPGTIQSLWGAAGSRSAVPLRLTVNQELVERLDVPLEGAVRIDLRVIRRQPMGSDDVGDDGEGDGASSPGEQHTGGAGDGDAAETSPAESPGGAGPGQ
jgi:hypothetical protein